MSGLGVLLEETIRVMIVWIVVKQEPVGIVFFELFLDAGVLV